MKKNNISFPYPVLGIGDDILTPFDDNNVLSSVQIDESGDFVFTVSLLQNDVAITQLISEGKAEYMVEADCQRTLYHRNFVSKDSSFSFIIPRKDVVDTVHLYPVVILKEDLNNYSNPQFNPDYEDATFDLKCGDILVCFNQMDYNVSIEYDQLTTFDSFMQIRRSETNSIVTYELDCPKINVVLPSAMYDQFLVFGQDDRYEEVIHASIVLNALLYALQVTDWQEEFEKEDRELWKETIIYRYKHEPQLNQYKLTDSFNHPLIAQALLQNPLKRMFDKLESSENMSLEND